MREVSCPLNEAYSHTTTEVAGSARDPTPASTHTHTLYMHDTAFLSHVTAIRGVLFAGLGPCVHNPPQLCIAAG
eukprot:3615289-Amphidinium_carterae.1